MLIAKHLQQLSLEEQQAERCCEMLELKQQMMQQQMMMMQMFTSTMASAMNQQGQNASSNVCLNVISCKSTTQISWQ